MKPSILAILGLGAVGIYLFARSADKNPWRGQNNACEHDFDAKSPSEQQQVLDTLQAMPASAAKDALLQCMKA